jgi:hypothetical protein
MVRVYGVDVGIRTNLRRRYEGLLLIRPRRLGSGRPAWPLRQSILGSSTLSQRSLC